MRRRKIDANPRKTPRQARAKATVDAIVTATAHILVRHGYEGATTARVAERAGVSIGSLYQYFPGKEALVAALIERHAAEILAVVERALSDAGPATLEQGLRAFIRAGAAAHRIDPVLHKILHEQVPRVGRLAKAMDTSRRIAKAIERFLRAHVRELRPGCDPALAAIVIETAIEALGHKLLLERRDAFAQRAIETEALRLAMGYLARS